MANIFKKIGSLFGLGNTREKPQEYQGQRPYTSLTETPEGALYSKTLQDRLKGIGVGYDPALLAESTNPYAATRRANIKNYEIPAISAQASARGVGRSTIPVNRIALSTQEGERDIAEKLAQVSIANEEQKRAEINNALSSLGPLSQAEQETRNKRIAFDYGDWGRVQDEKAAREASAMPGLERLIKTGAGIVIGGLTGGPPGAVMGGISGLSNMDVSSGISMIDKIIGNRKERGTGKVNIDSDNENDNGNHRPLKGYVSSSFIRS